MPVDMFCLFFCFLLFLFRFLFKRTQRIVYQFTEMNRKILHINLFAPSRMADYVFCILLILNKHVWSWARGFGSYSSDGELWCGMMILLYVSELIQIVVFMCARVPLCRKQRNALNYTSI